MAEMTIELDLPEPGVLQPPFARDAFVICHQVVQPAQAMTLGEQALDIARRRARQIDHRTGDQLLRYRVVPGDVVAAEWPELVSMFQSTALRRWVATVVGAHTIFSSTHQQSAININVLGEPGDIYRWHTDAAGFTLLLYLSTSHDDDGGNLEIRTPGSSTLLLSLPPSAGSAVLMDGTQCEHRVAPVLKRHERISIPMVFTSELEAARPAGLDDYLYSE